MSVPTILLSIIIVLMLLSFSFLFYKTGQKMNSWQVVGYSLVCLLVSTILLFYIINPDVIIKTPYMTLEKKVKSLETENSLLVKNQQELKEQQKNLQKVTTTLTKMILVVEDGVGKYGGSRPKRDKLIEEYKKEIEELLPKELKSQLDEDIQSLYSPSNP